MVANSAESDSTQNREYVFTDAHFTYFRDLIQSSAGIMLSDIKRDMVYGRLTRRLRTLDIATFDEYCALLKDNSQTELVEFTNAITTNLTSFFREEHHFEYLAKQVLPQLVRYKTNKRIRIWSAGCSTGEEPYSIAMTVRETIPASSAWDIKILATDLDSAVLETARSGIYGLSRVEGVSNSRIKRWFKKGRGNKQENVLVQPELQSLITFNQLNLMNEWPMSSKFDVIFCRNVVIYFSKDTQKILFDRYANYLEEDGHLIVGHSESLHGVTTRFDLLGHTIYQKIK